MLSASSPVCTCKTCYPKSRTIFHTSPDSDLIKVVDEVRLVGDVLDGGEVAAPVLAVRLGVGPVQRLRRQVPAAAVVVVPRGEPVLGAEGGLRVGGVEDGGRLADVGVVVVALDVAPLARLGPNSIAF